MNERVMVARQFKQRIAKLQHEREKLFKQALRKLKIPDTNLAWDYFMNDLVGYSSLEEGMKDD
jgi:hypothetical protein